MIESFACKDTEDVFNGIKTKRTRKLIPDYLLEDAQDMLDILNAVETLDSLRIPTSNRLEKLQGDRKGQYSIRINNQYRVCFAWKDGNAHDVEIVDYH